MIIETIYRALETLRLLTSFHGTLTFHEVAKPTWTDPNLWLAPVATLCSALLALFAAYLTIKKMRKQISLSDQHLSETQKTRKIAAKLDIAKDAKKQLSEISTSITPTNDKMMDLLIQKLKVEGKISETPETNISYAHDFGQKISIICVTGQSGTHNTTIPFIGPIGIIFSAIDMLGAVEARKKYLNPQDDFFQIRAQIRSYINILEILIFSIAPINMGDEVTLSYFGVQALELEPRNDFLRERFGFDCGCKLCRDRGELNSAEVQARLDILTHKLE